MFHPEIITHDGYPWIRPEQFSLVERIELYTNTVAVSRSRLPKVLCLITEPRVFRSDATNEMVLRDWRKFLMVLTHDDELMQRCRNAIFMPLGSCWIRPEDRGGVRPKKFGVSFVCGSKAFLEGHHFRRRIWDLQDAIELPKCFWNSGQNPIAGFPENPVLPAELSAKALPMEWQFHICIENSMIPNYFSEKLMDCLVTKTVPIYRGCPNIGDFFDREGMICFETEEELLSICTRLRPEDYERMLPKVEENFRRAQPYARPVSKRLNEILNENLVRRTQTPGGLNGLARAFFDRLSFHRL